MPKKAVSEGAGKRSPMNLKTSRECRARLEEAAATSGRSLTQEVEYRIEQSFEVPDLADKVIAYTLTALFGSKPTLDLCQRIALALKHTEQITGRSWHEDYLTRWEGKKAVDSLISEIMIVDGPPPHEDYESDSGTLVPFGSSLGVATAKIKKKPTSKATRPASGGNKK